MKSTYSVHRIRDALLVEIARELRLASLPAETTLPKSVAGLQHVLSSMRATRYEIENASRVHDEPATSGYTRRESPRSVRRLPCPAHAS